MNFALKNLWLWFTFTLNVNTANTKRRKLDKMLQLSVTANW